jgi:hypothetical protein
VEQHPLLLHPHRPPLLLLLLVPLLLAPLLLQPQPQALPAASRLPFAGVAALAELRLLGSALLLFP